MADAVEGRLRGPGGAAVALLRRFVPPARTLRLRVYESQPDGYPKRAVTHPDLPTLGQTSRLWVYEN